MRLPRDLMNCVAYLYQDENAAEEGDSLKAATAFWVLAQINTDDPKGKKIEVRFIVTNRHVIEAGARTLRWMGMHGLRVIREVPIDQWFFSSNKNLDLALWRVASDVEADALFLPWSRFITRSDENNLDMRIGDNVFMVGRHLNYDGKITNSPTARFGHIVQFPIEDITDDRGRSHKSFLVQAPSLPGFSGSPVFLYQDEAEKNAEKGWVVAGSAPRVWRLLGVNLGHLPAYGSTYRTDNNTQNEYLKAEINSGINVVIPAWDLAFVMNEFLFSR